MDDAPSPSAAKCNIMDEILSLYNLGTLPRKCFKGKAGWEEAIAGRPGGES